MAHYQMLYNFKEGIEASKWWGCFFIMFICVIKFNIIIENKSLSYIHHSKLNPFHPLSLPRSVMLKLSLKKKLKSEFYSSI